MHGLLNGQINDAIWKAGPVLPRPVKGQAQGVVNGKIIYAGGFAFNKDDYVRPSASASRDEVNRLRSPRCLRYCYETWMFDPVTSRFSRLPDAPVGAFWPEGIAVGDDFYLLTGALREPDNVRHNDGWHPGEKRDLTSPRIFRLRNEAGAWQWRELPSMRNGRFLPGVAAVGTILYVIGGQSGFGAEPFSGDRAAPQINAVEAMDLVHPEHGWHDVAPLPGMARECPTVATVRGQVYVFGGYYDHIYHDPTRQGRFCGDAYRYNPQTRRWEQITDLPFGIQGTPAVTVGDRYVVMMAGLHGGNMVEHPFSGDRSGKPRANLETIVFDTADHTYRVLPTKLPPAPRDPCQPQNPWNDPSSTLSNYWIWPKPALINEQTIYLLGGEILDLAYSNCSDAMWIGRINFSEA